MKRPKDFCRTCWLLLESIGTDREPPKPWRPIVANSGTRCMSHWRDEKKRRKAASHEKRVQETYGLLPGEYDRLYRLQSGVCAICKRATGATRKLSVDHDHSTGTVRGLLCRPCNDMLGHARDSDMFFYRAAGYLQLTPYTRMKGGLE